MNSFRKIYPIVLILPIFILTACNVGVAVDIPMDSDLPTPTISPVPTDTPAPTPTPLAPIGLLLAPPEADPQLVDAVNVILAESVPEMGYRFQVRPSLSEADFERDAFAIVVAISPISDISTLAANHPETRFLAVGVQGLESSSNLSTIGSDEYRLDQQGFVAGYIAALITPDWRVGVIGLSSTEETVSARKAFTTGVQFYCGLCLPVYPPFFEYPLFFELNSSATTDEWRAAADFMIQRNVETIYIVPGAGDDAMLRLLAQSGVGIIGGEIPLPDLQNRWITSLRFDILEAFLDYWPVFANGGDGNTVPVSLSLTDINQEFLSPGRQRLADEMIRDVTAGHIDLGVNNSSE